MYSTVKNFIFLPLCVFHVVTCLNIKNHNASENECVLIARNKTFEKCKLLDRKITLCNEDFASVRNCLPSRSKSACLRCLVDKSDFIKSKKYDNAVVAAVPISGHIWISGSVSINGVQHNGLNEIILEKEETVLINNETYGIKNAVKSRTNRSVRVGGSTSSKSSSSSSRTSSLSSKVSSITTKISSKVSSIASKVKSIPERVSSKFSKSSSGSSKTSSSGWQPSYHSSSYYHQSNHYHHYDSNDDHYYYTGSGERSTSSVEAYVLAGVILVFSLLTAFFFWLSFYLD